MPYAQIRSPLEILNIDGKADDQATGDRVTERFQNAARSGKEKPNRRQDKSH